ncbi:MAG: RluA family pseudouridine synthase [Alphaproteobacteria bacterium]
MERLTVKASNEDQGQRLDKVLTRHAPQFSRARLQALIETGNVTAGGKPVPGASHRVKAGDEFTVTIPPAQEAQPAAQDIALDIVYEDKDLLVINKAPGMVVHPAVGNWDGTLVNALLGHCGAELSGIGGVKRPGIVHRLDKETSGLMVVAKNDAAHKGLSEQLSSRSLTRVYEAIVWGNVTPAAGRIETNIGRSRANRQKMAVQEDGGKEAVTDYKLLETFGLIASLVECKLQTGRTHQIRVHMAHIKHWLVGDPVYGRGTITRFLKLHKAAEKTAEALKEFPRQALHAARLEFVHPIRQNKLKFAAEAPDDMKNLLKQLRKQYRG